jgi:hypothetical protein
MAVVYQTGLQSSQSTSVNELLMVVALPQAAELSSRAGEMDIRGFQKAVRPFNMLP